MRPFHLVTFALLGACSLVLAAQGPVFPPADNLARGRPATFSPPPSYPRCTDVDDPVQLTDGVYVGLAGGFWVDWRTVGWDQGTPVTITFDLGTVQPISGVSYSTAAGGPGSGVEWPLAILILVSEDGQAWRLAGDLISLAAKNGLPPAGQSYRFVTNELHARGRYLQLAVAPKGQFTFCDEVEVLKGPASLLQGEPRGLIVGDVAQTVQRYAVAAVMTPVFPLADNLAWGHSATFSPQPNYALCTTRNDPNKLTDGVYANAASGFWVNTATTVGWDNVPTATITFDLGTVQPISGLSYSTVCGGPGTNIEWPSAILILVSDDGQGWRLAGELISLAAEDGLPIQWLAVHRFVTRDLQARGRYVRLVVVLHGEFTFCDEIEVCKGPASLLTGEPTGPIVEDLAATIERCTAITEPLWQETNAREEARKAALREAARTAESKSATFPAGENLARGCVVTMQGAGIDDPPKLVDGQYADPATPFLKSSNTIKMSSFVTVDLGSVQPIAGVSYSTAAGEGGLTWPTEIPVLVGDDNAHYRVAGELVSLAAPNGPPAADHPARFRYVTRALQARGRYVQIWVMTQGGGASACDEIEVLKGPASLLQGEPTGTAWSGELLGRYLTRSGMVSRLYGDLGAARAAVEASPLPEAKKTALQARLDAIVPKIFAVPDLALPDMPEASTYKAIFPLNDLHARIYAVYGAVHQARGLPAFFAWTKHRFDPLTPTEVPVVAPATPSLDVTMLSHETRGAAFLLTNTTEQPIMARVAVAGVPGAPHPAWLRLAAVPWVDMLVGWTYIPTPDAAALSEAVYADGSYQVPVPAGMTRLVWLTIDSATIQPGRYAGRLVVTGGPQAIRLPLNLRVSSIRMARPRLSLTMWDYTDDKGWYAVNPQNRASTIALARAAGIDCPWAQYSSIPWPKAADFDANNRLQGALDFTIFDEWVARWPGARYYFVFLNTSALNFAGAAIGTPDFDARVSAWAVALAAHMRTLKLKPSQLAFLLIDEPQTEEQLEQIAAYARPIKKGAPEITLFEDPQIARPDLAKTQDAFTLMDILCPQFPQVMANEPNAMKYFRTPHRPGQQLWAYNASWNVDAAYDYRMYGWYAFKYDVTGVGQWAFAYGPANSWNPYNGGPTFAPAYFSPTEATDTVRLHGLTEGLEDYELLCMLRDAAARAGDKEREQAESLIKEAVAAVWADAHPSQAGPKQDRSVPDVYRVRIITMLEGMNR